MYLLDFIFYQVYEKGRISDHFLIYCAKTHRADPCDIATSP